ncbi:MAG TPA: RNB domain-containing ribonuclease, partial [Ideonella sp.]|nr:RNB domain-containing ribonuclease [Ideonella sp.]
LALSISEDPTPAEFQAIAEATKDRPDASQIHMMLLRSMQQAIYTPINSGHFGLAYQAYTHFTSPIRRYPDLLVHRVIKAILAKKRYHLATGELADAGSRATKLRKGSKSAKPHISEQEHWEGAGIHCSTNERRADEASRDVEAWLKCRYMREHLGEEFAGTVSAVTSFGLFVTLDALYVDGLVHITELGGEYYRFDEVRQELRGERTGIRYAIGARVRVQVSRVDLDGRKIDFRMVREGEGDRLLAKGRPAARSEAGGAAEALAGVESASRAHKRAAKAAKGGKGGGKGARASSSPRTGSTTKRGKAADGGVGKTVDGASPRSAKARVKR